MIFTSKTQKGKKMTKEENELIWRLRDLPTGKEIAELVAQEVVTKEEARKLLFSDTKKIELKEPQRLKELEDEIKFLRKVVDTLATTKAGGWTTVYHQYQKYQPLYPTGTIWNTYGSVLGAASKTIGTATGTLPVLSSIK